tara:strand:- start:2103 stop:2510 length:408 start_codon:yes stop_codon:yes gene_type:complete
MDDKERKELQHTMETQFRHSLYCDIKFPYLQSLGIKDILQGFGNEEIGFIGVLHLRWVNEDNNIVYDKPKEWSVKVKGVWKSTWYNTPEMGHKIAKEIESKKIIDTEKVMVMIHEKFMKYENMKMKSVEKQPLLN